MTDSHPHYSTMTLLSMPDEVLCHLLTTLALTCKRLRSLALDGPLRRHILLIRTPARLQSSLSFRPSRDTLAKQNILRGVHIHQHIRQGHYIGGDSSVRSYQVSCRLERQMLSLRISRKLKSRPDWTELVDRGLIPEEMFVQPEDSEVKEKWRVYQLQRQRTHRPLVQHTHHHHHHHHHQQQQHEQLQELQSSSLPLREGTHGPQAVDKDAAMSAVEHSHPLISGPKGALPYEQTAPSTSMPAIPPPPGMPGNHERSPRDDLHNSNNVQLSPSSRPRRQRKSISMVLVPKIELLRRAMDRDRLSRLVQKRPSPAELSQSPKTATVLHAYHLVAFASTSPDLVPLTAQLSFLLKGERLSHWLFNGRPSLAVMLNERHILKTEVRTAWMVCPGVTKKVRFYEGLIQDRRLHEQQMQAQWLQQHQQPHQHQIHVE
ncbi:hypothetical protein EMPS_10516 [Entomortierella parvispora]|uniref:F-box domain-containing protein n=1 Tax=Entomortierella parvispora TaxID=205924 RepID=A0A9P3M1E6_9FUNG|nr:hypothetical protein EMPS_10516 [Entomortierella parvispora]